ncbi:group II intron reverse transcriptase/maturase [Vagococcus fluvialis]
MEVLTTATFLEIIKKKFKHYNPRLVKRVNIPKNNGNIRPLGIPSIWDRLIQQCILQVLEPICEAKFYKHSYGFRPNRSTEHAIAVCYQRITLGQLQYVVDIDIKGFFDEVNHTKLMRQLWTMGIRDKQLLVIIRKILKAPIKFPDNTVIKPSKGTPQGGILSPLLADITLNEFDWWIAKQWEQRTCKEIKPQYDRRGRPDKGHDYRKLRTSTTLKEMYLVRYADDFKIFCRTKKDAQNIFIAVKLWLKERLKLPISEEKAQITNLKRKKSEFLGFELCMKPKRKSYVMRSYISKKALKNIKSQLKEQIKAIQKSPNSDKAIRNIAIYNSKVVGIHNYYRIATMVNIDLNRIHYEILLTMVNRLGNYGLKKHGNYKGTDRNIQPYLKTPMMRYLNDRPLIPIGFIKHRNPMNKKLTINKYTPEGRIEIHSQLKNIPEWKLKWLRESISYDGRTTVEYDDNRLSKFVAQNGKCGVTKQELLMNEVHCHHKIPWNVSKNDSYENLIIVSKDIHELIHMKNMDKILNKIGNLKLTKSQLDKVNDLRIMANQFPIPISLIGQNTTEAIQLCLF